MKNKYLPERGAAELRIVLENSIINTYHSDGTLLYTKKAKEGDWNKIIKQVKPNKN